MKYLFALSLIQGFMLGIEFPVLHWRNFMLVLDVLIIRVTFALRW